MSEQDHSIVEINDTMAKQNITYNQAVDLLDDLKKFETKRKERSRFSDNYLEK